MYYDQPMPTRERYVWVCTNRRPDGHPKGSCGERGAESIKDGLKIACGSAGLAPTVRVMHSGCMDLCEHGVAVAVMPDDVLLGAIVADDIPVLVDALKSADLRGHDALGARSIRDREPRGSR